MRIHVCVYAYVYAYILYIACFVIVQAEEKAEAEAIETEGAFVCDHSFARLHVGCFSERSDRAGAWQPNSLQNATHADTQEPRTHSFMHY